MVEHHLPDLSGWLKHENLNGNKNAGSGEVITNPGDDQPSVFSSRFGSVTLKGFKGMEEKRGRRLDGWMKVNTNCFTILDVSKSPIHIDKRKTYLTKEAGSVLLHALCQCETRTFSTCFCPLLHHSVTSSLDMKVRVVPEMTNRQSLNKPKQGQRLLTGR